MSALPLADFGLRWFEDIVDRLNEWFMATLTDGLTALSAGTLSTPLPAGSGIDRVFAEPATSDQPWHSIYEVTVAGETTMFALVVLFVFVQGRHFIRIFDIGRAYEDRRARRSAFSGAALIIGWYWAAVLLLYVVHALTLGLLPDIGVVADSLVEVLPRAMTTPITTMILASLGAVSILFLRAIFFLRELLLYAALYVMPIGLAIAYGNVPVISTVVRRLCAQFLALAILPLPTALLFRGYGLLFAGETTIPLSGPLARYIAVISLPICSLYVTWRTFRYASPLAARAISGTGRTAALAGTIAGAAYLAGPRAAAVASRFGARGAAASMFADRRRTRGNRSGSDGHPGGRLSQRGSRPAYRRTENDSGGRRQR